MKNYLIIGASDGIGKATAKLLSEGANVFGTYFTTQPVTDVSQINFQKYDVLTDEPSILDLPDVIDGIVYCPGSIHLKPFNRFSEEDLLLDVRLQVTGGLKVIQELISRLKKSEGASVVFISTVAVQKGFSFHTQVAISKGAVEGMTRALAAELAPKIRVNCVAPSLTDTKLAERLLNSEEKKESHGKAHPLHRVGEPEDIAQTIAFLLSDASGWMTGQVLHVDGGRSTLNV